MEQAVLQEKLTSSPFLAGASLPPEQVTAKRFRAGQIISDRPGGVSSVGMIVSGRVEVYSVALDGKDVQLNALTAGECFGVCNLLADMELETVLRCGEETEVLYIPKAVLLACMERDAGLAMRYHLLERQDEKGVVRLAGSREDLARRLGMSRAALFRELSVLQSMGAVSVDGNSITVEDRPLLEELLYHPSNTK